MDYEGKGDPTRFTAEDARRNSEIVSAWAERQEERRPSEINPLIPIFAYAGLMVLLVFIGLASKT